jgi:hypothetical protein
MIFDDVVIAKNRKGPGGRLRMSDDSAHKFKRSMAADVFDRLIEMDPEGGEWRHVCTEAGERAVHTVLGGFVFDTNTSRRDMAETRRWYVEVFETRNRVSVGTFSQIERLPRPYFDAVHEAALAFRLGAELKVAPGRAFSYYERDQP